MHGENWVVFRKKYSFWVVYGLKSAHDLRRKINLAPDIYNEMHRKETRPNKINSQDKAQLITVTYEGAPVSRVWEVTAAHHLRCIPGNIIRSRCLIALTYGAAICVLSPPELVYGNAERSSL